MKTSGLKKEPHTLFKEWFDTEIHVTVDDIEDESIRKSSI